jgi:hypothetical protein
MNSWIVGVTRLWVAELNELIIEGVNACVATVLGTDSVFEYEPTAVSSTPLAFTLVESWEPQQQGQLMKWLYVVAITLVVSHQTPHSELLMKPLVQPIMHALLADMQLGGRLVNGGHLTLLPGEAGWTNVGGVVCRAYRIRLQAFTKVGVPV